MGAMSLAWMRDYRVGFGFVVATVLIVVLGATGGGSRFGGTFLIFIFSKKA